MEPFKVYILGCGSALPTLHHFSSSQVVQIRDKFMMVDCGEGTQIQLRRTHIHFNKVQAVFISHLHGDHCLGLIGLISTFGLLGRTAPLHIYAPIGYEQLFQEQINMFCHDLDYTVTFHSIDTYINKVIYEDRSLSVETIPLQHRVPCCGFLFKEKPTLPHIKRELIDFYKIPVCSINQIKNGADWVTEDGTVVPNHRLTFPAEPPRSYAYCSDTRYMPELHEMIKGVTVLYHESTYGRDREDRAKLYNHSTAEQAATVAKQAGVGKLLLGHFSARYKDENVLLDEAKTIFANTELAKEDEVIDIC
jgi:ribonuclease Z